MRRPAVLTGVLFLSLASRTFAQPSTPVLVSGSTDLAIIDTNGNHIPDASDCHFTGFTDVSGNLLVKTMQTGGTPLQACSGQYGGMVDPGFATDTSISGQFNQTGTTINGGIRNPPFKFDGSFLPQGGGGGGAADGTTTGRTVTKVTFADGADTFMGSGTLCENVARVTLANGLPMAVGLDMSIPGFIRVAGIPFQTANLLGVVFEDVFIPQTGGMVTFAAGDPANVLIRLMLSGSCTRAPALSELKLIALALGLLAGGVWVLGRRRAFYDALPLP